MHLRFSVSLLNKLGHNFPALTDVCAGLSHALNEFDWSFTIQFGGNTTFGHVEQKNEWLLISAISKCTE